MIARRPHPALLAPGQVCCGVKEAWLEEQSGPQGSLCILLLRSGRDPLWLDGRGSPQHPQGSSSPMQQGLGGQMRAVMGPVSAAGRHVCYLTRTGRPRCRAWPDPDGSGYMLPPAVHGWPRTCPRGWREEAGLSFRTSWANGLNQTPTAFTIQLALNSMGALLCERQSGPVVRALC